MGFVGAKALGCTGFLETMGLVLVGMALAWFVVKKAGEKFN